MTALPRPCVCLVTDRRQLAPAARTRADEVRALSRWLDEAIDLVDLIQLREPDLDAAGLRDLAAHVTRSTRGSRTAVVVNDRADVALAARADGVHARADGPPTDRLRALGPSGWLVGRSIHATAEVDGQAPDYLIFGTVFPSRSKPQVKGQGIERLEAVVRESRAPVLAIGGIDALRAKACWQAGAAGVAAIGIFLPEGQRPGAMGISGAVLALRAAMTAV